ncbi:MAG: hypothetical protein LUC50_02855, partial [Ruminococcus sp.]|nr:hypothetical protein [Ruminococcus sp.]
MGLQFKWKKALAVFMSVIMALGFLTCFPSDVLTLEISAGATGYSGGTSEPTLTDGVYQIGMAACADIILVATQSPTATTPAQSADQHLALAYTGGVRGYNNSGTITNCYYLSTTASDSNATSKDSTAFYTGEVAYLLQAAQSEQVWGQREGDASPILTSDPTLAAHAVTNGEGTSYHIASYKDGICTVSGCSEYEATVQDEAGYYEIYNAGQLYWFAAKVN